ncbi:Cellulose binding domain-containing protein [Micromonospora coxensis]|uniref:Cellulose binding domain-containing protein n=1 Tax=Micromonospora coxensis TaxID=356852 RepID=A0A1C5GKH0_9ACTN|nr:Cellulose binding domain-containing protein [Micromonospora coxensis]
MGLAAIIVLPAPAHAATASFVKTSEWSSGYVGTMTVRNDSDVTLTSWRVEFGLPAGTTLGSHWNAQLTRAGDRLVFTNLSWNGTLTAGASTSFGWVAEGHGAPQGCTVNGAPCAGPTRVDVTPPSTPGNARYLAGPTTTLTWEPSTDDTGVVEYQIFHRTTLVASTTATSFSMPTPPPMVTTYGVRALDAAGNISPFAPIHFGQVPDSTPPTAPANLRIGGLSQGNLAVRWDAATDETFLVGYEVYLNGTLISTVGGTSGYVPYHGYGTYWVRVRARDSSGNLGPYAEVGLAIDPPPPTPAVR